MLESLGRKADPRKLRLFAAACARRLSHLLDDERSRRALDMAERYADRGKKGPPSRGQTKGTGSIIRICNSYYRARPLRLPLISYYSTPDPLRRPLSCGCRIG